MQIAITFQASHIVLNHRGVCAWGGGGGGYCGFKLHYFQHSFVRMRPHSFSPTNFSCSKEREILKKTQASYIPRTLEISTAWNTHISSGTTIMLRDVHFQISSTVQPHTNKHAHKCVLTATNYFTQRQCTTYVFRNWHEFKDSRISTLARLVILYTKLERGRVPLTTAARPISILSQFKAYLLK
jgi:hypothetical protein